MENLKNKLNLKTIEEQLEDKTWITLDKDG